MGTTKHFAWGKRGRESSESRELGEALQGGSLDRSNNTLVGLFSIFYPTFCTSPLVQDHLWCPSDSPTAFSWVGSIPGIFSGEHMFRFLESKTTKDGTTLLHEEKFTGLLGFLMGYGTVAKAFGWSQKAKSGFETFNVDLKAWVEGGK